MFITILCSCPDNKVAKDLATKLVTGKLAACVNIIPGIESIYLWEDKLEDAQESLLLIKASRETYGQIEQLLKANHPYSCPEIIAVPIVEGSQEYLAWLGDK